MIRSRLGRAVALVTVAAAATAGLAGCSGSAGAADGPVTLTYAVWGEDAKPTMQKIVDAFTAEHKNIKVDIQVSPTKEYFTKMQTALSGGSGPDVFWMNGPNFQLYASNGMLAPLDDAGVKASDYPQGLVDLYTYEGKLYGAPKDFDTIAVWYNKALFDAAGVAYPRAGWTWDDMKATAAKLTDPAKGQYGIAAPPYNQEYYYDSIAQAGGEVINAAGTKTGYGSPEALAGVTLWTDLIKAGSSPTAQQMTDTSPNDMFLSGKVAMLQTGSWATGPFAANADIATKVDVAPLPTGKAGNQSVIHGLANVVNAKGAHLDAAKEFAAFASGAKAADIMAASGTVTPAFNGKQQAWVQALPQYDLQVYIDELKTAVPYPVSKKTAAWNTLEDEILSQVWAGTVAPEAGLKDLAAKMQDLLDKENK